MERASDAAQAGTRGRVALLAQAQVAAWVLAARVRGLLWQARAGTVAARPVL